MDKEQPSIVTREKHPGRVAQGHKLAALMKQRKEELKQNRQSKQQTEQFTEQSKEQHEKKLSSPGSSVYGIGAAVALAGIAVFFLWKRPAPKAPTNNTTPPADDIFRMN